MGTSATSRIEQATPPQPPLSLAFELGQHTWKLGCTIGVAQQPRERMIPAGDVARMQQEIARAQQRFGLPEDARVVSCYEAGRDGFWLHRYLVAHGVHNHVIDSRLVKLSKLTILSAVTHPLVCAPRLAFSPTMTHTPHAQEPTKLRWSDHGLEATARVHCRISRPRASAPE
jgi:hypothetical protein